MFIIHGLYGIGCGHWHWSLFICSNDCIKTVRIWLYMIMIIFISFLSTPFFGRIWVNVGRCLGCITCLVRMGHPMGWCVQQSILIPLHPFWCCDIHHNPFLSTVVSKLSRRRGYPHRFETFHENLMDILSYVLGPKVRPGSDVWYHRSRCH